MSQAERRLYVDLRAGQLLFIISPLLMDKAGQLTLSTVLFLTHSGGVKFVARRIAHLENLRELEKVYRRWVWLSLKQLTEFVLLVVDQLGLQSLTFHFAADKVVIVKGLASQSQSKSIN